eukprot:gene15530-11823_t
MTTQQPPPDHSFGDVIVTIPHSPGGFSAGGGWITDDWEPGVLWSLKLGETLLDKKSKFQHVTVHETPSLGRVLALDGYLQASERDEKGYHEMI